MLDEKDLQAISQLLQTSIGEAEQRITKNTVSLMDAEFSKKFDLLAEGQKTILETLAPKSRVEELEDEVAFLKSIIRLHSEDIAKLKKAL